MIRGEGATGDAQVRPGKRAGWGNLTRGCMVAYQTIPQGPLARQLSVGRVLSNDREGQVLHVQPHLAQWKFVKIVHVPLYQSRIGYTITPTGTDAVDTVRYEALTKVVQLLQDGGIGHADSRELLKRGWGLSLGPEKP